MTTNIPPVAPAPVEELVPRYSASEQPVTRGARIMWHVWVLSTLLTVVIALILFLVDKLIM